jgi:Xaa-Pro aminopeptidase
MKKRPSPSASPGTRRPAQPAGTRGADRAGSRRVADRAAGGRGGDRAAGGRGADRAAGGRAADHAAGGRVAGRAPGGRAADRAAGGRAAAGRGRPGRDDRPAGGREPGPPGGPAFPRDEYDARLRAVRAVMRQRQVDVLVVDAAEHLAYLTGFDRSATRYQACLVPLAGDPVMVLRELDEPAFRERSWLDRVVTFEDTEEAVEAVARTVRQHGWAGARLGLELDSHYLTVRRYRAIEAALPGATLVDFSDVLWELRLRKSPREVAWLRAAARIADAALLEAVAAAGPGVSERVAAAAASRAFVLRGADHGRVGIVTSGPRSGSLHGTLGDRRLERGDLLHLELVPQVQGYSARLMRPTVIGPPSAEQAETARRLVEIQDRQLAAMRPGTPARDVDRICRDGVRAAGLRERYTNATGYTLGYYAQWGPRSSDFTRVFLPSATWALEPGMVFHMYTGARGMAFSETVLVTDAGAERLTRAERRLFVR